MELVKGLVIEGNVFRRYTPTALPSVEHINRRYANIRLEGSHQATRQRERAMRGLSSLAQANAF